MADDGILSQEEIDALSAAHGASATGDQGGSLDLESYKPVAGIIAEQASTVLMAVLNKEISIKINQVAPCEPRLVGEPFTADALMIKVNLAQAASGSLYYIFTKKDVAVLADLMMMGDGTAEYEEDFKDAINELVNQIMGAICSTFGSQYGAALSVEPPVTSAFNAAEMEPVLSNSVYHEFSLSVAGVKETRFLLLVAPETAAALGTLVQKKAASKGGAAKSAASEPAEASFAEPQAMESMMPRFEEDAGGAVVGGGRAAFSTTGNANIDLLLDVQLDVSIELGRTKMSIKRILELGPGSIIELDRMAGEPVDLLVNDKVVAKGEVVVVDENFGIRIVSLVSPEERLKSLR